MAVINAVLSWRCARENERGVQYENERGVDDDENERGVHDKNERGVDDENDRGVDDENERGVDDENERGVDDDGGWVAGGFVRPATCKKRHLLRVMMMMMMMHVSIVRTAMGFLVLTVGAFGSGILWRTRSVKMPTKIPSPKGMRQPHSTSCSWVKTP